MKKVFVIMIMLLGAISFAQENDRQHRKRGFIKDLSPEQVATLHTKKLTLALDLSEQQQREVQKLEMEKVWERRKKMEARKAQKEAGELQKLTNEERYDEQIALLDRKIAEKSQMREILTQEQYERWEKLQFSKGHHLKRHGHPRHRNKQRS